MKLFDQVFFCDPDNRMTATVHQESGVSWPVAFCLHRRVSDGPPQRVITIYMTDMDDLIALRDHLIEVTKEPAHEQS